MHKIFNKINGAISFKHDYLLTHVPVYPSCVRPRYKYNIHGRIHSDYILGDEYINVGIEAIGYKPLPLEELLRRKEIEYNLKRAEENS